MDDWAERLVADAGPRPHSLLRSPGAQKALDEARMVIELEDRMRDSEEARTARFLHKCLCLATDLETFEALVAGESVPLSRLNPDGIQRYGLRA